MAARPAKRRQAAGSTGLWAEEGEGAAVTLDAERYRDLDYSREHEIAQHGRLLWSGSELSVPALPPPALPPPPEWPGHEHPCAQGQQHQQHVPHAAIPYSYGAPAEPPWNEPQQQELCGSGPAPYHAVGFSYGSVEDSAAQQLDSEQRAEQEQAASLQHAVPLPGEQEPPFVPLFAVPERLGTALPATQRHFKVGNMAARQRCSGCGAWPAKGGRINRGRWRHAPHCCALAGCPFGTCPSVLSAHMPASSALPQVVEQTASFVRQGGGQLEVLLRVKQANNPLFSFLMPGDQLHRFYRCVQPSAPTCSNQSCLPALPSNPVHLTVCCIFPSLLCEDVQVMLVLQVARGNQAFGPAACQRCAAHPGRHSKGRATSTMPEGWCRASSGSDVSTRTASTSRSTTKQHGAAAGGGGIGR